MAIWKRVSPVVAAAAVSFWAGMTHADTMRVVSLNLWESGTNRVNFTTGEHDDNRSASMTGIENALSNAVGSHEAVIGLQEVDNCTTRSAGDDVAQELDDSLGSGWWNTFRATIEPFQGGSYGIAVLSNMTKTKTQYIEFAHDPNNPSEYGNEPRGGIAHKMSFGGKLFWFVNVHLAVSDPIAVRQVWQLMGFVKTLDPSVPVIVLGDFNLNTLDTNGNFPILMDVFGTLSGFESLCDEYTSIKYKSEYPGQTEPYLANGQIDFAFLYDPGNDISSTSCDAKWASSPPYAFSDHKALVVDVNWAP